MKTWKSLSLTSLVLCTGGLLAACGDDEPNNPGDIDAADHDAEPDDIDAMDPVPTRAGTIAVTDISLTSTQGAGAGIRGGVISAEFTDLSMAGGEVIFGTTTVGGCVVTKYDADSLIHPTLDGGAITVGAPETGNNGLLKTVGPCNYQGAAGYLCASAAGADRDVTALGIGGGKVSLAFGNDTFAGQSLVGSYIKISGFTNAAYNESAATPAGFAIVDQPSATTLVVYNPGGAAQAVEASTGDIDFTVLNAVAPIPTNGITPTPDANFLGDETSSLRIQKPADPDWPAIDYTVYARGTGFDLADASAQPHQFPFTAADVMFTCSGTGGNCGGDAAAPTGTIEAFIVSGRTTDVVVTGLPDFYMPPAAMATEYTTFQCGFLVPDTAGTIPEAAVTAILSTNPTRIETRVLRVAGTILQDGLNETFVVVGHGQVGHSTPPP